MTALQEKLSQTNNKVAEFRNQCEKLKKDLKIAHKVSWGTLLSTDRWKNLVSELTYRASLQPHGIYFVSIVWQLGPVCCWTLKPLTYMYTTAAVDHNQFAFTIPYVLDKTLSEVYTLSQTKLSENHTPLRHNCLRM